MNYLIITHYYEEDGVIGSVRWTNFAHRFAKEDKVFVVTHQSGDKKETKTNDNIDVFYIDNECAYRKRGQKRSASKEVIQKATVQPKKRNKIKELLRSFLYHLSMKSTAQKNAKIIYKQLKAQGAKIDYIFSTSRPFINGYTAYYLSKKLKAKWLLDQRDLPYSDGASKAEIAGYKHAIRKMDKRVTVYTLVSKGMCEGLIEFADFNEKQSKKVHVLNNGYTRTDELFGIEKDNPRQLVFSYVGDLYEGRREADLLFDALYRLKEEGFLDAEQDVKIEYAGNNSQSLYDAAQSRGLQDIIVDHGRVPHKQAMELLYKSDILLLLTWNTEMDRGILPGKFYEYMLASKPILCITVGNVPGGEAEGMVEDMQLGIAVNTIEAEKHINRLADYLKMQIERVREQKPVLYEPIVELKEEFDYDNLFLKLKRIINID